MSRFRRHPLSKVQRLPRTCASSLRENRRSLQFESSIARFSNTEHPLSSSTDLNLNILLPCRVLALREMQVGHEKAPYIALNAHTLEMFTSAAERALRMTVRVHLSETRNVLPVIEMEGLFAKLIRFCGWMPSVTILGNGFQLPSSLASDSSCQPFSHTKRGTSAFTQDQLRDILCRKKKKLAKHLGVDTSNSESTYLAQAVADCIILYCYIKWGLPISTMDSPGWLLHQRGASNAGNAGNDTSHGNFQIRQPLMLPISTAMRTVGEDGCDIEVAVDTDNKLVMRDCRVQETTYEQSAVREYKMWASRDGTYERIPSGTMREGAFQRCGERLLLVGSLS